VIPGKDGSTTVIAERFSVGSGFHVDMKGNVRDRSNVYYGSILVARIENDGTLSWLKNLPKSQTKNIYGASRSLIKDFVLGEMGFTVLNKHSDPIFVFLDNVNNLELPDTEVPDNHRDGLGGFLTGYRINRSSGEVQKMSFLDLRDFQGMVLKSFARDRVYQLSENEFAVEFNTTEEGPVKKSVMVKVLLNK